VVSDGAAGVRLPITAYVGNTVWAGFHVDLVGADILMTGHPEDTPPIARVAMPDVKQSGYRVYPLVDHIADKVAATFDGYGQDKQNPSTRFRDLVDLVAISLRATVEAETQMQALWSEAARRAVHLPERFAVPDRGLWKPGYAAEARRSLPPIARDLDEALETVRPFIDPLLGGNAFGTWDPATRQWTPPRST
jgi:hypothetical protein